MNKKGLFYSGIRNYLLAAAGLGFMACSGASTLADTTITLNLGQTAQNYTFYGITVSSGTGYLFDQQGACSPVAGNTVCHLTGSYTGTTTGFTSGTYDLTTSYTGTAPFPIPEGVSGPTPILSATTSPNTETFFDFGEDNTTMTLSLTETGGTQYVIPIVASNNWQDGAGFFIQFTSGAFCTGLSSGHSCILFNVALDGNASGTGAAETGPVTGSIFFNLSGVTTVGSTTPEPGSLLLVGSGLLGLAGSSRKWFRR